MNHLKFSTDGKVLENHVATVRQSTPRRYMDTFRTPTDFQILPDRGASYSTVRAKLGFHSSAYERYDTLEDYVL
jgi:hypothetical protein